MRNYRYALILLSIFFIIESFSVAEDKKPVAKSAIKKANKVASAEDAAMSESAEFQYKLSVMYSKTETSIKLLREQIVQNQSAPFLPDLYLRLADLLTEKSNILYYQRMEREKSADFKLNTKEKLNPIVVAVQEAIAIYMQILKEFPNFEKYDKVLYRLAFAQKSIDEGAAFVATAEKLLQSYPKTKEAMQVRLLLGQFYYDQQDFKAAAQALLPAQDCDFPYERNAARYRLGMIRMNEEKSEEALSYFTKVATDEELKEGDNPLELSIKTRTVNSNIKREALIDSIRVYTEVHKKNPDPVAFYSRIAPSEALFQEVIEKLAYRYIFLKNETQAMSLLRVLCERVADPQKVINIYQEVLLLIPPLERIEVPYQEMHYVLNKYNDWFSFFDIPQKTKLESYKFFETQIREMGTKSHDLGKSELSAARKDVLFERARNFYHLYLGFFSNGPEAVKIATNLADVYYYQKDYLRSGDLYLRVFQGEFGAATNKESLLQNAILCFQKPTSNDFYEIVRNRGLLVKAINSYMAFDVKKKNDPKLNFILVKSTYEQGMYKQALPGLINYISRYAQSQTEAEAAADIGLDYYNTRSDFKGLVDWTQKVLAIKNLSPQLRVRLEGVKAKALLKKIDEEVKSKSNYDAFAQGKVYFETALAMQDNSMKSVVLEQALARSKAEKDVNTFVSVAKAMAAAEKKADKRVGILLGMGEQTLSIGRFYQTFDIWQQILSDNQVPETTKKQVKEKVLGLAIMLKDWAKLKYIMSNSQGINETLGQNAQRLIGQYMESAAQTSDQVLSSIDFSSLSVDELLPYFKGQFKVSANSQSQILAATQKHCSGQSEAVLCRWARASALPAKVATFGKTMQSTPATLQSVEQTALLLSRFLQEFGAVEATGDPMLDIFSSRYKVNVYEYFAQYLRRVGDANPQVAEVLGAKAAESLQNARKEASQCMQIISAAALISPINKYCMINKAPSLREALTWRKIVSDKLTNRDPISPQIEELQKQIFVDPTKPMQFLDLCEKFYAGRHFRHALAFSSYGINTFPQAKEDFAAILGCSLVQMGMYSEGAFHLKNASDFKNIKAQCWASLKAQAE